MVINDEGLKLYPNNFDLVNLKVTSLISLNRKKEALALLDIKIAENKSDSFYIKLKQQVLNSPDVMYDDARQALNEGQYQK